VVDDLAERDTDGSKNSDDSHDSGSDGRRRMPIACECTYSEFLKFGNQVKYVTCTLLGNALTWMFPKESDKVEKYVGGLPDMIQGSVMASKPKKMQDAIEFATKLMDQKICTLAERD
ncbi:hypothetical protein Tco_0669948, partial [Tanacetum coccineum]